MKGTKDRVVYRSNERVSRTEMSVEERKEIEGKY